MTNGRTEDGKRKIGQCSGRPETAIVLQKLLHNMFPTGPQNELGKKLEINSHDLPKIAGTAPFLQCTLFVDTSETELTY